jgi:uncharacterized protein YndB with AHSA1/START domain
MLLGVDETQEDLFAAAIVRRMRTIEFDFEVAAPPDRVFAALTDLQRLKEWRTLESVRLEREAPARVGTRLHTTVKKPGQTMRFINEVTELDPVRRRYDDRWLEGTFVIESGWEIVLSGAASRICERCNDLRHHRHSALQGRTSRRRSLTPARRARWVLMADGGPDLLPDRLLSYETDRDAGGGATSPFSRRYGTLTTTVWSRPSSAVRRRFTFWL